MKLEVGEFYLSASGEVIEIIYKEDNMFEDVYLNSFFEDGICNGDIRDFDLIAHIPEELHKMICELVNNYHSNNEAIKQLEELENIKNTVIEEIEYAIAKPEYANVYLNNAIRFLRNK